MMHDRALRGGAWTLLLTAAAFWLWFGVASAIAERLGPVNYALHLTVPGGVLLISAAFAWKYRRLGAALLIVEGLLVTVAYPWLVGGRFPASTIAFVIATMALPPLVAGIALWRTRHGIPAVLRPGDRGPS